MGKGKPRHNPDKKQNNYGSHCSYYEENCTYCEALLKSTKCKGNPYNCIKSLYELAAGRSDIQKINNVQPKK
jgi:hypothetical protein